MKKELLIIVPAARVIKSKNFILQKLILLIYHLLSFHPLYLPRKYGALMENLKSPNRGIILLKWPGNILRKKDLKDASKRLFNLIKEKSKKHKIKIFASSFGAKIAQLALNNKKGGEVEILLQIGAFNNQKRLDFKNVKKIINIYSENDKFTKIGMALLEPFKAEQKIYGENVININLPGLEHQNFYEDYLIKKGEYKNKRIFYLYKKLLQ